MDLTEQGSAEALEAGNLFLRTEGVDIAPAAAVAVSSLEQAVIRGEVNKTDVIMLNITGGGYAGLEAAGKMRTIEPNLIIDPENSDPDSVAEALSPLFN